MHIWSSNVVTEIDIWEEIPTYLSVLAIGHWRKIENYINSAPCSGAGGDAEHFLTCAKARSWNEVWNSLSLEEENSPNIEMNALFYQDVQSADQGMNEPRQDSNVNST